MVEQEQLDSPYLTRQLIAYIGNKRRLLGFFRELFAEHERDRGVTTFVDPFAGSGAVARLGRLRGYRVAATDIERYAAVLNRAALCADRAEADRLVHGYGGLETAILELNRIGQNAIEAVAAGDRNVAERGYIAEHYAPRATTSADFRSERLFYTTENASYIDAVRDTIEEWFHCDTEDERCPDAVAKSLLLAPLLYEASVHANTSGVFKAYHKGFGGHGRDALGRILARAELEVPSLIDGPDAEVLRCDAAAFCREHSADIVYLDPPYNQHQYGSNYFMLNTIARWDKPDVDRTRREDGSLIRKAGIRSDWAETRSPFCSRAGAVRAFEELLESIDARVIVLSYNTEGIVPFEELYELLARRGEVRVRSRDYVQFRGGRQSNNRRIHTSEIAFIIRSRTGINSVSNRYAGAASHAGTSAHAGSSSHAGTATHAARALRVNALARASFVPDRVVERFGSDYALVQPGAGIAMIFERGLNLRTNASVEALQQLPTETLERLESDLSFAACRDNVEELEVLFDLLERGVAARSEQLAIERRALQLLRKLAHPRYRAEYEKLLERFLSDRERASIHQKSIAALKHSAASRFDRRR